MFSLSAIQPSFNHNSLCHGAKACNNKVNGMQAMVMQSQENLYRVLPDFEAAIAAGYDPNDVKAQIFRKYGITEDDFTDFDAKTLVSKVEQMYKANHSHR
jgi:hypothetical protein